MWKKRYLSYQNYPVDKEQNLSVEQLSSRQYLQNEDGFLADHKKMIDSLESQECGGWETDMYGCGVGDQNLSTIYRESYQPVYRESYQPAYRESYRASLRDGLLWEDRLGPLVVTHSAHLLPLQEQDQPLDLTLSEKLSSDTESDCNTSPSARAESSSPIDVGKMFPYLKYTNTGALVLWNFLWALLQDDKHSDVATWVSNTADKKFKIVNPNLLAEYWRQVKDTPSMEWTKIRKILDLYVKKNLIEVCSEEDHLFMFLIVPKYIKEIGETDQVL